MDALLLAIHGLIAQSYLEWLAMLLGLAYLFFIIRENILAWPCAFFSTLIYIFVFWEAALLMESLLNIYYLLMAIYGYWQWTRKKHQVHSDVPIIQWPLSFHLIAITSIIVISALSGYLLENNSHAAWPYLDSFTTWGAVFTTYLVAKKVYENWYYWLIINSISLFLFIERELYPTALLMCIYLLMIIIGIIKWRKVMQQQPTAATKTELSSS